LSALLVDGPALAQRITDQVAAEAASFAHETGRPPGLAVVRVGEDPASEVYVRNKRRACERAGIRSWEHHPDASFSRSAMAALLTQLNSDPEVDGILVQLPLPKEGGLDAAEVQEAVDPRKDVDGLHANNSGLLFQGRPRFVPCTPAGVMAVLDHHEVPLRGAHAVVVGRSNIVGRPMALLLQMRDATVTMAHSRTTDLTRVCRSADVLVAAVGHAGLITKDHVKPGAVVIDVGISRMPAEEGAGLKGDVHPSVGEVASLLTPVPRGIGPLTIAMLLRNTLLAARQRAGALEARS
jgi:methylenetetrahydrofolate dehydrogenase (NADP+)/methenyltetrahydrofolate cyclohydrolase